jgi:hypothetical protein
MNIISLVSGDTLANLQVTLARDDTGGAFNINLGVSGTVTLALRKKGTTVILSTITYDSDASNLGSGFLQFPLGPWVATVEEGYYEGEVEITFDNGTQQTVFEHITFRVRTQFS